MSLSLSVARALEAGRGGVLGRGASAVWASVASRRIARPLQWRESAIVVAVGGATLGGSGKTPLAVACAAWLAKNGAKVAFVGHAYAADPGHARVVSTRDVVGEVGDEALEAATILGDSVPVVVAPTRQGALDLALTRVEVAVLDGVLQCTPRRASLSLLAATGHEPWGAARCPPGGDLRAPIPALLAACDRLVLVGEPTAVDDRAGAGRPIDFAEVLNESLTCGRDTLAWSALRSRRVGLFTALSRPHRLVKLLASRTITPHAIVSISDHARRRDVARGVREAIRAGVEARIDLWVASPKCATHLGPSLGGIPVATLDCAVRLSDSLRQALLSVAISTP